jgi:small subunit ribosomal protein S9
MEINLEVSSNKKSTKQVEVKIEQPKIDKLGRSYATGKRKTSIARVWLKPGKGKIIVNKKTLQSYFSSESATAITQIPFEATDTVGKYDILCTVTGGGISGQIDALKHGISKALVFYNPEAYRSILRKAGLLTRDSRVVERKKYGHKKARKSFQFSKR